MAAMNWEEENESQRLKTQMSANPPQKDLADLGQCLVQSRSVTRARETGIREDTNFGEWEGFEWNLFEYNRHVAWALMSSILKHLHITNLDKTGGWKSFDMWNDEKIEESF